MRIELGEFCHSEGNAERMRLPVGERLLHAGLKWREMLRGGTTRHAAQACNAVPQICSSGRLPIRLICCMWNQANRVFIDHVFIADREAVSPCIMDAGLSLGHDTFATHLFFLFFFFLSFLFS